MSLNPGERFGAYEVISRLGAGGMGEVYLTEDTRLRRKVAVKILPAALAGDDDARKRLIREAHAIAALDHPNICTVFEAGEADGRAFIAMQYIDGETLAAKLRRGPLPVADAVGVAIQVGHALAEAHAVHIVHRDIKPQNIMMSRAGQAIVLDFGLAKSTRPAREDAETTEMLTHPGVVAGTIAYMSPEQVRNESVDERSDIFSFGATLYETLAGHRPFDGGSSADTISQILMKDPPPAEGMPAELRRITQKCLEKDRGRRYQTARDLVLDLETFSRSGGPVVASPHTRRLQRRPVWIAIGAVAVAGAAGLAWWQIAHSSVPATPAPVFEQITALPDAANGAVLSADGRMVAFYRAPDFFQTRGDIYTKMLPNGDLTRLTNDSRPKYGLTFTPDGTRIAFTVLDGQQSPPWNTWTVPVTGGQAPTRLLGNAAGLSWIDGRHILFSEIEGIGVHMGLVTSTDTRQERRVIYFPAHERAMAHFSALSPDGKSILAVEMNKTGGWERCRLLPFDASSAGNLIGPDGPCYAATWSPDGRWMYFSARTGGASHIWRQRFPDGVLEAITSNPTTDEQGVSVAPDGKSVITSVGRTGTSLWIHSAGGDRLLTSEGFAAKARVSADGAHVYFLLQRNAESPTSELTRVDLSAARSEPMLPGFSVADFDVSANQEEVVFSTKSSTGEWQVWLAYLDRRAAPRMVVASADHPHFGAGEQILFRALDARTNYLDRINRDGTERIRVLSAPIIEVNGVSPDGEWVAVAPAGSPGDISTSALVDVRTGALRLLCQGRCLLDWSRDGRWFAMITWPSAANNTVRVMPLPRGQMLPLSPAGQSPLMDSWVKLPGVKNLDRGDVAAVMNAETYVFLKSDNNRNLFRIPVR